MSADFRVRRRGGRMVVALAVVAVMAMLATPAVAKPGKAGFQTGWPAMLTVTAPGGSAKALISTGDVIDDYMFDTIPDGIAIGPTHGRGAVDIFVNHETSRVAFPLQASGSLWQPTNNGNGTQNDFENARLSMLRLHQQTAGVLEGSYVIPGSANYQRFCSNFMGTAAQGFTRPILFTNEEATDIVYRSGEAYPAPDPARSAEPTEQAGVVVAYDVQSGTYRTIYGMGRHNHENSVAIPGYEDLVVLSGDDTFSAPASQLYSYIAEDTDAVWNDEGHLWAFKSDNPNINDYGDITGSNWVSGTFIPVPDATADGGQSGLESWSNTNNVFQFIRVEDIAYDRTNPNIVYFADTGEPRAVQGANPGPDRLIRAAAGTMGPYPNGRIWKMTLNETNPLVVDRLEILIDADPGGPGNPAVIHQPDNVETTANSLLITEDPGSHNQGPGIPAKLWRYDLHTNTLSIAATVDQSTDGDAGRDVDGFADGATGAWESSGIIDASSVFGAGTFLVTIQAHTLWIEKDPADDNWTRSGNAWTAGPDGFPDWMNKREAGQLLLIKIPGA